MHEKRNKIKTMDILKQLKAANKQRQDDWKKIKPNATDWDLPTWGNAVAGETGEMCNVIKKIHRGDFDNNKEEGVEKLASEVADVVCYLDLLCQRAGIDLGAAVVNKFNEKSEEIGSEVKIYYY